MHSYSFRAVFLTIFQPNFIPKVVHKKSETFKVIKIWDKSRLPQAAATDNIVHYSPATSSDRLFIWN